MTENIPVTWGQSFVLMSDQERFRQRENIESRYQSIDRYIHGLDESNPSSIIDEIARCLDRKSGFFYWCENYGYTFDPRDLANPHKRFILYDYQKKAAQTILDSIRTGKNVFMEKSRDMGASWLMMAIITYCWLFDESFHALIGSRKEDLVDSGTVDDLFGKIDYMLERLPSWMLNSYEKKTPHRKSMHLKHPESGNIVTGESANKNFGRGPRKNLVYLDEFAFWEDDASVWVGVQDTAPCKIVTSTPCGENNQYARLRNSGISIITMHWTDHPCKDLAWYSRECEKRKISGQYDTVAIAQELNIDYKASSGRLVFPVMASLRSRIMVPYIAPTDMSNQHCAFYGSLDWGTLNPTAFHVHRVQKISDVPRLFRITTLFEYYEPSDLPRLSAAIKNCPYYPLIEKIFSDPSMWFFNQATKDGMTSVALLARDLYGIYLTPGIRGDAFAIERIKYFWNDIENPLWTITEDCPNLWREFSGLHYVTQSEFQAQKKNTPEALVDKDNHSWDGFKYFLNSYLNAPMQPTAIEPQPVMGWAAMQQDFNTLRTQKLEKITKPRVQKRHYWRG